MQITGDMLIGASEVRGTKGTLRAFDPARNMEIEPEFGAGGTIEVDRACALAAMRFTRTLAATRALSPYIADEYRPGIAAQSDEDLLAFARAHGATIFHPSGTCKMGRDPMAVVDERLRVHGFTGLRVADASIMPTVVSGNTNAACVMIGEKASDMILEDARAQAQAPARAA